MSITSTKTTNSTSIHFSHGIFLHAVDAHFEPKGTPQKILPTHNSNEDNEEMMDSDINVKFFLSLDEEENLNDVSTENNSEGEESSKEVFTIASALNKDKKFKINDFLEEGNVKTEIEKIKADTIKGLRTFQMQMYNKFYAMKGFYLPGSSGASLTSKQGIN
jgi:GTP-dependent phosphoenolpyruvate carboxykinase